MSLYIIGSPIGNLKDITLRSLEVLQSVDKIYCEDTRRTRNLLEKYEIRKPIDSLHHHSNPKKIQQIINELENNMAIAYLSDAGTPGIADPGGILVQRVREAGLQVVPIPGPSAVTTLLSVSGLPCDQYYFMGYLPTKKGRQTAIKKLIESDVTTVFFETAPRMLKFLREIQEFGGNGCYLVVGRELTKQFEEIVTGLPKEVEYHFETHLPKGEFVIALMNN